MSAEPLRSGDAVARDLRSTISKTRHICEICVFPRKSTSLSRDTVVVTLGADTCRALVARELAGPARHDGDQRFEFLITSDRALVTRAARSLLNRVP